MAGCPWFSTGQKPCGAWPRKYATAISPERMKATGRVNSPTRRRRPPNTSSVPAMPGSDMIGAVPPPGMMAAGNANSLAVPNCMKRKAATIRRTLSKYGARVGNFAGMLGAVMIGVSLSVFLGEGDRAADGQPRAANVLRAIFIGLSYVERGSARSTSRGTMLSGAKKGGHVAGEALRLIQVHEMAASGCAMG